MARSTCMLLLSIASLMLSIYSVVDVILYSQCEAILLLTIPCPIFCFIGLFLLKREDRHNWKQKKKNPYTHLIN